MEQPGCRRIQCHVPVEDDDLDDKRDSAQVSAMAMAGALALCTARKRRVLTDINHY